MLGRQDVLHYIVLQQPAHSNVHLRHLIRVAHHRVLEHLVELLLELLVDLLGLGRQGVLGEAFDDGGLTGSQ